MFDKLMEFLASIWNQLCPVFVINSFQMGVVIRLGKFSYVAYPGLHFKIPFADVIYSDSVVTTTLRAAHQSLTTKDQKALVVSSIRILV